MNMNNTMKMNMNNTMKMNNTMGMNMGGMDHGMMMKMYFHLGAKVTILFKGWSVDTTGGLVGSCIAVFILAALYEGLKASRELLKRKYGYVINIDLDKNVYQQNGRGGSVTVTETKAEIPRSKMCEAHHIIQSFLHMVQVTLSYFLMLIFMTYNVWLCIAVVLGAGCGYFLFGWKMTKIVDVNEHCH